MSPNNEIDFIVGARRKVISTLDDRMKTLLIILNIGAAIWMLTMASVMAQATDHHRHSQVRELCSAGVINTNALHKRYADCPEGSSPESELAQSLSHHKGYFYFLIWPAALLAILNAAVIGVVYRAKWKESVASNIIMDGA